MKRKALLWGALVALGALTALIVATGAFGFDSGGNPGVTGPNSINWTGNGFPVDQQCSDSADPGQGGFQNGATPDNYMLWILNTDGGSITGGWTLTVGGTTYGNSSANQLVTPFVDPTGAVANFDVASTGTGAWILTISHGCGTGRTPADNLNVSKDASGSYDKTFSWNVDKSADTDTVYSAGGGESGTVNYTVNVSHDSGTINNVAVTGTITVSNPATNDGSVTINGITDNIVDGTNTVVKGCTVDFTNGMSIPMGGDKTYGYSCDLGSNLPSGDVFNHVTVTWPDQDVGQTQHLVSGSASFQTPTAINFAENDIGSCVDVKDTIAGDLGEVCVGGDNPTTFNYPETFTGDPAGTCTPHDNTASATTEDTDIEADSNTVTVQDCQGADLKVSKTASGTYDRECSWTISKSATPASQEVLPGQQGTFNYSVTLGATCNTVKNVKVTGTITVTNPNDWEDVTLTDLTDALDVSGGANCTVDKSPGLTIPRKSGGVDGSVTYNYTCSPASLNDTLNTATATWDAGTYHTPTGTASGTAPVSFTQTLIDDCVDVSDTLKGALGHFCTDASGNITGSNGAVNPIKYSLSFAGPTTLGTCSDIKNTASAADNSTPQVTVNAYATVHLCTFGPRFTPGYWKNHLAPNGTSGCKSLPNGTSCGSNGPFASAWTNSTQWKCLGGADNCSGVVTVAGYTGFKVDTILKAAQIFSAMSCSFSGNAANQNQQAIGCLAGKLLAAKYNININKSNTCIAPVIALADSFLSPGHSVTYGGYTAQSITYTGPSGTYTGITSTGTSNNQRQVAIALQNALDAYDNGGGCH